MSDAEAWEFSSRRAVTRVGTRDVPPQFTVDEIEKTVQVVRPPFRHYEHASVGEILHKACDWKIFGRLPGGIAEPHPLHPSLVPDLPALARVRGGRFRGASRVRFQSETCLWQVYSSSIDSKDQNGAPASTQYSACLRRIPAVGAKNHGAPRGVQPTVPARRAIYYKGASISG